MRNVVTFVGLALVAAIIVPRYTASMHSIQPPPSAMAARPVAPVEPAASNARSILVPRDARGHFQVDGRINGRHLQLMIDTGASVIALTANDAAMIGMRPTQREFTAQVRTANGTVFAAPVQLNTVEIGELMLHDVAAMVLPEGALSDNLLGLSFLSRLQRFQYSNGAMVLEQ